VLIPRPETEGLITAVLKKIQSIPAPRLADIGVGSGILAVTLACERTDALVWATDLSADAVKVARKNAVIHGVQNRVQLFQGDLLGPLSSEAHFDVIVSNPPYVREDELPDLQPEVRDYEPVLALSGVPGATGADGAAIHRRLLSEAKELLKPGGWLLLEVGYCQAEGVAEYARSCGWEDVAIENDFAGIGRVVAAQWTKDILTAT
jgi:release factor glutamine methyltransferase